MLGPLELFVPFMLTELPGEDMSKSTQNLSHACTCTCKEKERERERERERKKTEIDQHRRGQLIMYQVYSLVVEGDYPL